MSLQDELQPTKIYGFVEYLGGAGSDSTIEKTSLERLRVCLASLDRL
jgi:hypothetical protein